MSADRGLRSLLGRGLDRGVDLQPARVDGRTRLCCRLARTEPTVELLDDVIKDVRQVLLAEQVAVPRL